MNIEILNIQEKDKVNLQKWAEITIAKWEFAVIKNKKVDTSNLLNSFTSSVSADAQNNKAMISFAFNYYLRMIDMGVGKGKKLNETGTFKRKKHPVYNKIFYAEIQRLGELLTNYYAKAGATVVVNEFNENY